MKQEKKRIAIIIQMLRGGGAERTAANMSIDLSPYYEVHLIVFDANNTSYNQSGIVHDLQLPASKVFWKKCITLYHRIKAVKAIKQKYNISCTVSLMEGANLVNVLSRKNDKIIISERNLISFFIKGGIHKLLIKYIHRKADKVVALSNLVRDDLIKNFGCSEDKIVTIYNSVDISKFSIYNKKHILSPYIVTMGRLTYQKAQWHIIRAFRAIINKYPKLKLVIIGDGELKNELELLVDNLGLANKVVFTGYIDNPHSIIKNAELFVFSSIVEGLGSVILEALACNKTVISTDCDAGPREILAPSSNINKKTDTIEYAEYGVLIPTENDKFEPNITELSKSEMLLAEAISTLLDNDSLRKTYEEKTRKRILDFSPERIAEQWVNLISEVNG